MRIKRCCPECKREDFVTVKILQGFFEGKVCLCGATMVFVEVTEKEEKQLLLPGCIQ